MKKIFNRQKVPSARFCGVFLWTACFGYSSAGFQFLYFSGISTFGGSSQKSDQ